MITDLHPNYSLPLENDQTVIQDVNNPLKTLIHQKNNYHMSRPIIKFRFGTGPSRINTFTSCSGNSVRLGITIILNKPAQGHLFTALDH